VPKLAPSGLKQTLPSLMRGNKKGAPNRRELSKATHKSEPF